MVLAVGGALALRAAVSVRPRWDPAIETTARIDGPPAGPNVALTAWLEPGLSAIVGALPIIPRRTNSRSPGNG